MEVLRGRELQIAIKESCNHISDIYTHFFMHRALSSVPVSFPMSLKKTSVLMGFYKLNETKTKVEKRTTNFLGI